MITDFLKGNFDGCYSDVINSKEFQEFYDRVNLKAQNCKIAYEYHRSAYKMEDNQGFDDVIQVFNYSSNDGGAYYTLAVKYCKDVVGKDSYDRDIYLGTDDIPFIIRFTKGSGYSLGDLRVKEPMMNFNLKDTGNRYNYSGSLKILKGLDSIYPNELGYIEHHVSEGFELVEYENSTYWGSFEDNQGISVFQRFDGEYSTGSGYSAGHCHIYVLQKDLGNDILVNEVGQKFKVHRTRGCPAYFGSLDFEKI